MNHRRAYRSGGGGGLEGLALNGLLLLWLDGLGLRAVQHLQQTLHTARENKKSISISISTSIKHTTNKHHKI